MIAKQTIIALAFEAKPPLDKSVLDPMNHKIGLWIRRFQFRPAEWLWRSMSYGKL
jgi:hypothetical protein